MKACVKTSALGQSHKKSDSDEETEAMMISTLEEEDFDIVCKRLMMLGKQNSSNKFKDESEAHILQRLKEFAIKSTSGQLHAFVIYHLKQDEVILMQPNAAKTSD